jgi:hypothetical protein
MKTGRRCVSAIIAGALFAGGAASWADSSPGVPAIWAPYDMIINLDQLPKQYSCNDLWYKFRAVLRVIGAQRISETLPYDCGKGRADHGLSPKVHIVFALPDAATGIQARYPDMRADSAEIRLEPGHPPRLDESDCGLVQQINNTLIQAIPLHVVRARWNCAATDTGPSHYELTLQVLKPPPPDAHNGTGAAS